MHADYALLTGVRHQAVARPGQDYALAGDGRNGQGESWCWAAVSDGCSTAGRTDLGARAWAMAAESVLGSRDPSFIVVQSGDQVLGAFLDAVAPWRKLLAPEDLYATLGVIAATERRIYAAFFGDGAIVLKYASGDLRLVELEYAGNAPDYPAYQFDDALRQRWRDACGGERAARWTLYGPDGEVKQRGGDEGFGRVVGGAGYFYSFTRSSRHSGDVVAALVASDGIASRRGADIYATARALTDIKGGAGAFMQRRLGRLGRAWAKDSQLPQDDLSIGALWLGETP